MAKNARPYKDFAELKKIVALVPKDRRAIAERLADELAFMSKTLQSLRESVAERGAVELFEQGSQRYLRESPALKSYNTTVQRYSLLYKQLIDLLPKQAQTPPENPARHLSEFRRTAVASASRVSR